MAGSNYGGGGSSGGESLGGTPKGGNYSSGFTPGSGVIPGDGSPYSSKSGNSGSYGMGGAGLDGGGGSSAMGGTMMFDDGGAVPDGSDNDADDQPAGGDTSSNQPTDPLSTIRAAMAYGRQSMGMPANMTTGPDQGGAVPGLDDGGAIPDPSQDPTQSSQGTGSQLPDPRKTIAYLSGAGGVRPDIADALEQHLDPQGKMQPAERTMAAISAAPSPEAQFGLMQHYRTRFNAYSGAAKAALDQGNMAQAAQHATNAMANVPSGMNVRFAPSKGGLMMHASKIGGQQAPQQGLDDGGSVDVDNPAVMQKADKGAAMPGMDDGGEIPDNYEGGDDSGDPSEEAGFLSKGSPLSSNVEDRRTTLDDNPDLPGRSVGSVPNQPPRPMIPGAMDTSGMGQPRPPLPPDAPPVPGVGINAPGRDDSNTGPVPVTPEQLKKAMDPLTPDKMVDHGGWDKFWQSLGGSSVAGDPGNSMQSPGGKLSQDFQGLKSTVGDIGSQIANSPVGKAVGSAVKWLGGDGSAPDVQAATTDPQGGPNAPWGSGTQNGAKPAAAPTPTPPPQAGASPQAGAQGGAPAAPLTPMQQGGGDDETAAVTRLQKQADNIFGKGMYGGTVNSQAIMDKKEAYVQKGIEALRGSQGKMAENQAIWGNKSAISTNVIAHQDSRNQNTVNERLAATKLNIGGKAADENVKAFIAMRGQEFNARGVDISDPQAVLKAMAPYQAQIRQLGITPQQAAQNVPLLMQQLQQQDQQPQDQQQGSQGAPQQGGSQAQQPQMQKNKLTGEVRMKPVVRTPQQGYDVQGGQ
jgi:hypothetical protein